LTSRNPDSLNSATIAFDTFQKPCGYTNLTCPKGFTMDPLNSICYMIISNLTAFNNAPICPTSTMIQFRNDEEIDGFFQLLKLGLLRLNQKIL
jgi:hypothetical protein